MRFFGLGILLLAPGCAGRPHAAPQVLEADDAIHVGVILSLSGPYAAFGQSTLNGVQLALDEINCAGVPGGPIVLDVADDAGEAMARYAWEHPGARRVAVVVDSSTEYAGMLSDSFQSTFLALGGEIVSVQRYAMDDMDYGAQLAAIQPLAPDAIYLPGYYTSVGLIAKQARGLGIEVPLLGGDGWDSSEIYGIGGEAIVGGLFTNHFAADAPDPTSAAFVAHYEARFAAPADGLAALGYDAMGILAAAMEAAGSTERDAVRDALAATRDFPGVTGDIAMNGKRDPIKPVFVQRVTAEGFVYEAMVGVW